MSVVEKTGKTVEEAIDLALIELQAEIDMVDIEVIEEGKSGIFGLIGNKQARVRVALRGDENLQKANSFVIKILSQIGVDADVRTEVEDGNIVVRINGEDVGILIGRRGETLDALQYITSLVVNKNANNHQKVIVDIESYRSRREETLVKLAERLAGRVSKTKKSVTLEPMTPYERRIIHSTLQDHRYVDTHSVGEEPHRKVVIKPK